MGKEGKKGSNDESVKDFDVMDTENPLDDDDTERSGEQSPDNPVSSGPAEERGAGEPKQPQSCQPIERTRLLGYAAMTGLFVLFVVWTVVADLSRGSAVHGPEVAIGLADTMDNVTRHDAHPFTVFLNPCDNDTVSNNTANLTSNIVTILEKHCDEVTRMDSNTTPAVESSTDFMVCELMQQSCSNTTPADHAVDDDKTFPFMLLQRHCEEVPEDLNEQFAAPYLVALLSYMAIPLAEYLLAKSDFKKHLLEAVVIPKFERLTRALRTAYDKKAKAGATSLSELGISRRALEQMSACPPPPWLRTVTY
jgi:hypothetical protein